TGRSTPSSIPDSPGGGGSMRAGWIVAGILGALAVSSVGAEVVREGAGTVGPRAGGGADGGAGGGFSPARATGGEWAPPRGAGGPGARGAVVPGPGPAGLSGRRAARTGERVTCAASSSPGFFSCCSHRRLVPRASSSAAGRARRRQTSDDGPRGCTAGRIPP